MDSYKIKVNDEAESREIQELFLSIGLDDVGDCKGMPWIASDDSAFSGYTENTMSSFAIVKFKEITLPQLRDLVVLKRGDVRDATHKNSRTNKPYLVQGDEEYYMMDGVWIPSNCLDELIPIEKTMKEYLDKDYVLRHVKQTAGDNRVPNGWVEVPEGAEILSTCGDDKDLIFWKAGFNKVVGVDESWDGDDVPSYDEFKKEYPISRIVWQRSETEYLLQGKNGEHLKKSISELRQPEELPFIDDEPFLTPELVAFETMTGHQLDVIASFTGFRKRSSGETDEVYRELVRNFGKTKSLNDQYAEIEKVRQSAWDKQEGGNHYKDLAIQPMRYALANKLDYAQANVVKYVTRHANKNGREDLLKAIHNIELMIEHYYG